MKFHISYSVYLFSDKCQICNEKLTWKELSNTDRSNWQDEM
jgi:hypothetical protein